MTYQTFTTPLGTFLDIYSEGLIKRNYVPLAHIAKAIGYTVFCTNGSLLATTIRYGNFKTFNKPAKNKSCNMFEISTIVPFLEKFINVSINAKSHQGVIELKSAEYRANARILIDWLEKQILPKYQKDFYEPEQASTLLLEDVKEEYKMDMSEGTNNTTETKITNLVTKNTIEEIGETAESIKNVFGVSKNDALIAAVQLKSEEINRDLTSLINILKSA